eukprot:TRINITY_DN22236_c0_g2_i1.p1 TRINITY_DN22236_c0_g2~~TRINITY_DN22236_c0_g2_i1.p1  ORF type:complete len:670 (+),score=104.46 TRINITY_DN22236_c0_g2_i1:168-2177(+)
MSSPDADAVASPSMPETSTGTPVLPPPEMEKNESLSMTSLVDSNLPDDTQVSRDTTTVTAEPTSDVTGDSHKEQQASTRAAVQTAVLTPVESPNTAAIAVSTPSTTPGEAPSVSAESGGGGPNSEVRASGVNERERLELEALYPAALMAPVEETLTIPPEYQEDGEPKYFLHIRNDRVEAFLTPFTQVIDFGLPNTNVSSSDFVGLRKIPIRRHTSPGGEASAHARGAGGAADPPTARRSIRTTLLGMWRRGESPAGSSAAAQQMGAPQGGAGQGGVNGAEHGANGGGEGGGEEAGTARRRQTWHVNETKEGDVSLQAFELLWKEGRAGNAIRRLRIDTNELGYDLITAKIDGWAAAAQTSSIMTDAAQAALKACGGSIKENPGWSNGVKSPGSARSPRNNTSDPYLAPPSSASSGGEGGQWDRLRSEALGFIRLPASSSFKNGGSDSLVKEPMGTMAEDRARIDAAKDAMQIMGSQVSMPREGLPENVISWGSVMVEGKYLPKREGQSAILTDHHFKALAASLPVRLRTASWNLLYSASRDGISLNTLYRKVGKRGPAILIVRDTKKHVFGCFGSEDWKVNTRYYGNGECFVFQVQPELKAFRWTRANSYFMYSTPSVLAMGGGTHYGLLINSDLLSGSSGECETFGSTPLASGDEFDVSKLEVWGFR